MWTPDVKPGEVVLVACNTEARRGVPFHVILTDQRLIHARNTVWARDGMVTESQPLSSLSEVRLEKPWPFALWAFGIFALCGFAVAVAFPSERVGWFMAVSMLAAAGIAFGSARQRLRLAWRAGGRFSLTTPAIGNLAVRAEMAGALREIARLLGDRNQLSLLARERCVERESEQDREPEDDDRRLCSDGSCTGVIGADGRCKSCGLSA
jgi:hypothetical protein